MSSKNSSSGEKANLIGAEILELQQIPLCPLWFSSLSGGDCRPMPLFAAGSEKTAMATLLRGYDQRRATS
jgi:hypothetical protein